MASPNDVQETMVRVQTDYNWICLAVNNHQD